MSLIWTGLGSGSRVTDARFAKEPEQNKSNRLLFLNDTDLLLLPHVIFGGTFGLLLWEISVEERCDDMYFFYLEFFFGLFIIYLKIFCAV